MKNNLYLILIGVLFLAVALLYIDRFANSKNDEQVTVLTDSTLQADIVYVQLDTLLDNYDFYNDIKTQLMGKQSEMEANLNSKIKSLERRGMELQQKFEKRLITTADYQAKGEQLMMEQQQLGQVKAQYEEEFLTDQQALNKQLYDTINVFLKEFNASKKYKFIVSHNSLGTPLLYADPKYDITSAIVDGLNKRYRKYNTTGEVKKEEKKNK